MIEESVWNTLVKTKNAPKYDPTYSHATSDKDVLVVEYDDRGLPYVKRSMLDKELNAAIHKANCLYEELKDDFPDVLHQRPCMNAETKRTATSSIRKLRYRGPTRYIMDTGSGKPLISKDDIPEGSNENIRLMEHSYTLNTANGRSPIVDSEVPITLNICDKEVEICPMILEKSPAVLAIGEFTMEKGYDFIWKNGRAPYLMDSNGNIESFTVIDNIPYKYIDNDLTIRQTRNLNSMAVDFEKEPFITEAFNTLPDEKEVLLVKRLNQDAILPTKATDSAAGFDLYTIHDISLPPGKRQIAQTGLSIAIPLNTYARIAPRSGLALKMGIDIGAGVIDRDYRGEIGIILFNLGDDTFEAKKGDKIAQLILERISYAGLKEVSKLDDTIRGVLSVDPTKAISEGGGCELA